MIKIKILLLVIYLVYYNWKLIGSRHLVRHFLPFDSPGDHFGILRTILFASLSISILTPLSIDIFEMDPSDSTTKDK